ncbi:glycosyltransferase family 25 protein [Aggregatibacter actinomycetemcomitans]|uniref:glycosyltransferase family 25 protein n=1 Tax=Aggregatibacter actinomycetemcomitans TaxID=714 RepID=UPI00197B3AC2|nr:glycosyltransferase family 25 protein [Aggregatibacter actinomycetemcomitans]MBN6075567.1 glycosyltransferase family 25 protein [Aggregatibacter actinomycetemcomitans]
MNSTENKNFVISISTAEQRRNHIIEQFTHQNIPFEFFDAFTPSDKLTAHLQRYLPNIASASQLTMGEKGCLMSHFMLWKKCIDENLDYVTLFEDDILLGENANKFLAEDDWLKVRFNFQEIFVLRLETFLMPVQLEKQAQIPPFQQRNIDILTSKHFGTAGYVISQGAAKYLIALFEKLATEEIKPIDEIIFNQHINTTGYRVYQLNPAICVQELQLNQEASLLVSNLEQERKNKPKIRQKKTLKQRLIRIKENMLRALNKKKWEERKRAREMENKQIVPLI